MKLTSSFVAEHQASLARKRAEKLNAANSNGGVEREKDLHRDILAECKRRGWLVFHGSMAHNTFRTPGEPDFVILADAPTVTKDARTFLIEAKTRTGKLSPDQQAIHAWAHKLGHTVHVVRSMEEFMKVIEI